MSTPGELFQADKLAEAVAAALAEVKKKPTDSGKRYLLSELLCLAGDLERADRQLETVGTQNPASQMRVSLIRQLIRAEQARQQYYASGRLPEFVAEPTASLRLQLEGTIALRGGDRSQAADLFAQAEEQRVAAVGECNGQAFEDFRDLDDVSAGVLEVLTSTGKFYLIPIEAVQRFEFAPPERPLDLMWRQMRMAVQNGPEGEVFMPSVYAPTYQQADDRLKLGRATEWLGESPPVTGIGQRAFLAGEELTPIMEIKTVKFRRAENRLENAEESQEEES